MTKLIQLERKFLSALGKSLGRYGFGEQPVGQSFRMEKPFGWASVHFGLIRHPPGSFDVTINMALRMDKAQAMLADSNPLLKKSDLKNSATIGCELGNLLGEGQKRWSISNEEDVIPVSIELLRECEANVIPFIERYSDLEVLLSALKSDERFAQLVLPISDRRRRVIEALSILVDARVK